MMHLQATKMKKRQKEKKQWETMLNICALVNIHGFTTSYTHILLKTITYISCFG